MLINMIREPRRSANIFGNNGPDGLLGFSSTWENLDVANSTWNYRARNQICYGDICPKL